ncbi:MAG: hypothetical protein ABJP45_08630 [Cyclobacteriaceae bacterium]
MVTIIEEKDILEIVKSIDLVSSMKDGFIQYSNGRTIIPPVGELLFEEPVGETHIKYGYIKNTEHYTIKIASGFPGNSSLGIPSSQGVMLLFSQNTGETKAILLDNGKLTNLRTAAAGALVAKYFKPKTVTAIGILGTGIQARLQLNFVLKKTACKSVWIWGRNTEKARLMSEELDPHLDVQIANSPSEVAMYCNFIVTTTPSKTPLLRETDIQSGTHITAVGSDTPEKQELEAGILQKSDIVIADSIPQSNARGEIFHAVQEGAINPDQVIELGNALQNPELQRTNDRQITVADLTGVAVQDIMIAEAVYSNYLLQNQNQ